MAQWNRLCNLPAVYRQQLDELYDKDVLPMEVRHYLAGWIEEQEWKRAAQDYDLAMVLYQVLLGNLDIQHSRFVHNVAFLQRHNIRRYKQNFQMYEDDPCVLASNILWYLEKEKDILQNADLTDQVHVLQIEQEAMEISSQQDLERKLIGLQNEVQVQIYFLPTKSFFHPQNQLCVVRISQSSPCIFTEELINLLVKKELVEWQRRQQRACIGAPVSVCLEQLEKWFTRVAVCLFQVRDFLDKLDELVGKVSYANDPIKIKKPALQQKTDKLLHDLLKSSFVVESQPSMPQGKGALVLRTNVQFSVKTRSALNYRAVLANVIVFLLVYRRFNVLGTVTKALNMVESQNGGMVADFRHLTLKEQKSSGGKGSSDISLSVTEELHIICFDTVFQYKDLTVHLQASSLPVVIISNSSQQQSAWASILWFNMISQDTKDVMFFTNCPAATWPQFAEMLSWQFLAAAKRGLTEDQQQMIARKLFGIKQDYDNCNVAWSKFSKENSPDTFWVWFDGILVMVKTFLEDLWREGHIMGFVSKGKEKLLLKKKQSGTFLLRFSESVIGGITFSWVETSLNGEPDVKTVQPFTKVDLMQIPLVEIIRNFQILEAGNIPVNPLVYLYPNTSKEEAFAKYYSEESGDKSPYIKYIKTKLVFVSKENTLEAVSPVSSDVAQGEGLEPITGLCGEVVAALPLSLTFVEDMVQLVF
uniref:Signal transducer and activator of transcription n=1 Tax=Takifugu rubripes TaxID=31033 RepID=A0A674MBB3_TAKRU